MEVSLKAYSAILLLISRVIVNPITKLGRPAGTRKGNAMRSPVGHYLASPTGNPMANPM